MKITENTLVLAVDGKCKMITNDQNPNEMSIAAVLSDNGKVSTETKVCILLKGGYWEILKTPQKLNDF